MCAGSIRVGRAVFVASASSPAGSGGVTPRGAAGGGTPPEFAAEPAALRG
jgi:hypothetical protein